MQMTIRSLALGICFGLGLGLSSISSSQAQAEDTPFGTKADVTFAKDLWEVLKSENLVGKDRIHVQPFEGSHPHGAIQQVLGTKISLRGREAKVIVKVNHGGDGANVQSVYDDPNRFLGAYTVMFKRKPGYDPENQDWFWAKYGPDGSLDNNPKGAPIAGRFMKGADKGCIACHTAAGGADLETMTTD